VPNKSGPVLRRLRDVVLVLLCLLWTVVTVAVAGLMALSVPALDDPSPKARGTGHDAEWLGHAWVDGRKTQSDVDDLARRLRGTGIKDLFVHAGPFDDDGTLDPAKDSRAAWAVRQALPGVRVQAWLGAHAVPGQVRLGDPATRGRLLTSIGQVLDDGFDGVHLDFEPVVDGDPDLLGLLDAAHAVTRQRGVLLSVSASHTSPAPLLAPAAGAVGWAVWSNGYLHQVAVRVDQVALMVYDSGLPTRAAFGGYVRRATLDALDAVPPGVALFIGLPAYHDDNLVHHADVETVGVTLRGVRQAVGDRPPARVFGVAIYVDFTITDDDWATYRADWDG